MGRSGRAVIGFGIGALIGLAGGEAVGAFVGGLFGALLGAVSMRSRPVDAVHFSRYSTGAGELARSLDEKVAFTRGFIARALHRGLIDSETAGILRLELATEAVHGMPAGMRPDLRGEFGETSEWPGITRGALIEFLEGARQRGIIDANVAQQLLDEFEASLAGPAEPFSVPVPPMPEAVAPPPPPPGPSFVVSRPAVPAPPRAPAPLPPVPVVPSPLSEAWRRAGSRMMAAWKSFASDVAIHSFTYLGVLLFVVCVLVFFTGGFFGDLVSNKDMRPIVALAIPLALFGVAWLLRAQTGIPFTADAVGLIAAVVLPMMLSALFQDGSSYPPDVNGPARWFAYAGVGVVVTVVYALLARRSAVYAYLVAPAIWVAAGALGLFVEDAVQLVRELGWSSLGSWDFGDFTSDGISSGQITVVVIAVATTVALAAVVRNTRLGPAVSGRIVVSSSVALPALAVFAFSFTFADAMARGVASPGLEDVAGPSMVAFLAAGLGLLGVRASSYAWERFGERTRKGIDSTITAVAYSLGAVAWIFAVGLGVPVGWIGAGLVAIGLLVAVLEHSGERPAGLWAARVLIIVGLAMALADGGATLAAWAGVTALVVGGVLWEPVRRSLNVLVAVPRGSVVERAAIWLGVLVTVGVGGGRLAWPGGTVWLLAGGGVVLGAARFLTDLRVLRSLATLPAGLLALSAIGVGGYQAAAGTLEVGELGVVLLLVSAAGWLLDVPLVHRLAPAAAIGVSGAALLGREIAGVAGLPAAVTDASVLGMAALGFLIPSLMRASPVAVVSGVMAHVFCYAAFGLSMPSERGAVVGLGAVVLVHGLEAFAVDRGRSAVVEAAATRWPRARSVVEAAPALIAASVLPFLAVVASRQIPAVAAERPRSGLVLAATAWLYVAGVAGLRKSWRSLLAAAGLVVAGCGIAVAAPSLVGSLFAVISAAGVVAELALLLGRPGLSAVAWVLGGTAGILTASRLGMEPGDLHFVLYGMAAAVMIIPAALDRWHRGPEGGVRSRWLQCPVAVGLAALPAALALVVADGRVVGPLVLGGAAAYVVLGVLTKAGGVSLPVSGLIAITYAHYLEFWESPVEEPIVWMPLAGVFLLAYLVAPRRSLAKIATDGGPGLLVSALAVAVLATVLGFDEGGLGHVLVASTALLAVVATDRRSLVWAAAALVVLAGSGFAYGDGWLSLMLAADAVAVGVVAAIRLEQVWAWASAGFWAGAYGALAVWGDWGVWQVIGATGAVSVVVAAAGLVLWLGRVPPWARLWAFPLLALSQVGAVAVAAAASDATQTQAFVVWSGVAAAEAVLTCMAAWRRPEGSGFAMLSGALTVAAVALGAAAVWDTDGLAAYMLVVAAVSIVVLIGTGPLAPSWRRAWCWTTGMGLVVFIPILTLNGIGGAEPEMAMVLLLCGAALGAGGLRSGVWMVLYVGMLAWLAAAFILSADLMAGNRHAYAVPTAVVLLAIIELERLRSRLVGRRPPDELRYAEWVLMLGPPAMAAIDMFDERAIGLLLAGEGIAILLWAFATEVRRRLVVGLGAITCSVLITVGILLAGEVEEGAQGTLLTVGIVAAVLLILIGSVLEKSRERVGRAVKRITAALEEWE